MSDSTVSIPPGQPIPEPGVEPDNVDSVTLLVLGVVSVAATLGVMYAAAALYFQAQRNLDAERVIAPTYANSDEVVRQQLGLLAKYGPPEAEGKPYKIPIEDAKQLVLAELQSAAAGD